MAVKTGATVHASDLRDTRYGEIFLIKPEGDQLKAAVYNTTGLNDCPVDAWRAMDAKTLAKQFGVAAVYLNGPRFWTLDAFDAYAVGDTKSFDGIEARLVGELFLPPGLNLASRTAGKYYHDVMIKRETEWFFAAGNEVYELRAPDAKVYVMQAYSHIIDDNLSEDALAALGDRLNIPDGWRYHVRTLDRDQRMRPAGGQAHVLQDELENTYMLLVDN